MKAAKNFRAATMMLRQLYFAVTDLTLHSTYDPAGPQSVHELMREISKTYQVPPRPRPQALVDSLCSRGCRGAGSGADGVRPIPVRIQPHFRWRLLGRLLLIPVGRGNARRLPRAEPQTGSIRPRLFPLRFWPPWSRGVLEIRNSRSFASGRHDRGLVCVCYLRRCPLGRATGVGVGGGGGERTGGEGGADGGNNARLFCLRRSLSMVFGAGVGPGGQ